jgi:hypothetical protein
LYLCRHHKDTHTEWAYELWGFKHLNNCDWLLHYTASLNLFLEWKHAYYVLSNYNTTKYVRTELFDDFECLRRQVDTEYGQHQEISLPIPF